MASRVNITDSQLASARPSPSICTIPLEILGNMCYTGFASWGMRLESGRELLMRCFLRTAQFTPNKLNSLDCGIAADHIGATQ